MLCIFALYYVSERELLFHCSVLSESLLMQRTRLPSLSLSPGACSNSMSIKSVFLSNHCILRHPLLFLHSIFPSIRVFSNKLALCIRWPKCWSFSISPIKRHLCLFSLGMVLISVSCTMSRTSVHSSSGSLSDLVP